MRGGQESLAGSLLPAALGKSIGSILLGTIIANAEQGAVFPDGITAAMFESSQDRIIFNTVSDMIKDGIKPNLVLLPERLKKEGKLEAAGGADYIASLTSLPGTYASQIGQYGELLRQQTESRAITLAIRQAAEDLGKKDIEDIVRQLKGTLSKQEKTKQKNTIRSATEILEMDFPPIRWIIPDFLAPGLTVFSGAEKLGKSWLSMGIGISLTRGAYVMGKIKAEKTDVLYIALEDHNKRLQRRLNQLQAGKIDNLFFADKWTGGTAALESFLKDHPSIRMVIIDTFIKFFPSLDLKDYTDITNKLTQLKNTADSLDIGIMVIHHTRKGANARESGGDWMDDTLGSKAINGTADQTITLKRGRGSRQGELKLTGRDIEEQELALTFDADCSWTIAGDKKEIQESDTRQLIYDWLRENGANGPSAIHKGLTKEGYTGTLSTIQNILIKMANSGALQKSAGAYMLSSMPSTGSTPSMTSMTSTENRANNKENTLKPLPLEILPEYRECYDFALSEYLEKGLSSELAAQKAWEEVKEFAQAMATP
jgi:hypothetical protein